MVEPVLLSCESGEGRGLPWRSEMLPSAPESVEDFAQPTEKGRPRRLPLPDEGMHEPQSDRKGQEDSNGKEKEFHR